MLRKVVFVLVAFISIGCDAQDSTTKDKEEIRALLKFQQEAWSNYDIEGFMQGYWKSKDLKFYGSSGITYGWEQTLANYKKRYPTKEHTGKLNFTIDDISPISEGAYHVMGQYHLTRTVGDANGVFLIILKKIDGAWKIIADMSC